MTLFASKGKENVGIWKDGLTTEQVAESILRNYLIRCHHIISKNYPKIANMDPAEAADYLLHLRDSRRINIRLYNKTPEVIGCEIIELEPDQ